MWVKLVPLKDSIATRLLKVVFSFYLILAITVTLAHIAVEYVHSRNLLFQELEILEQTFQPSLERALWEMNNKQLQSTLNGIMQLPIVVGIEIVNPEGIYLGEMGKVLHLSHLAVPNNMNKNQSDILSFSSFFYKTFKINHMRGDTSFFVGVVTIYSSRNIIIDKLKFSLEILIVSATIKIIGFWVLFLHISRYLLSKPLAELTRATEQLQLDNLENVQIDVNSKENNELKILGNAFRNMIKNLLQTRSELYKNNELLEIRVSERTLELTKEKEKVEAAYEKIKSAEADLKKAKEAAEDANRAKTDFLSSMSHELRTPLNSILGFSNLMKHEKNLNSDQIKNLEIINRSGEHLLNLINNVLDITKIEAGRVEIEESLLDLFQFTQELTSLMSIRAREKGLDFILEQSKNLPSHISVDVGKLRQVLINLIENAIKYTAQGNITLKIDFSSSDRENQKNVTALRTQSQFNLKFAIIDTGPGIPTEDRERIFEPYVQLDNRPSTEAGNGLGLALCRQYTDLMSGKIWVAGKPGKGSIFHVEIPVIELPSEDISVEIQRCRAIGQAEGQPRLRLLIVEDHPENRLLLLNLLKPLDFDLREAANGQEAIALFEEWQPHLIFMDILMPVMNGLEAIRYIKATDTGADTKIIALTAHSLEEERNEIMAAGCDDFIRKPYKDTEIFDALTKHLDVHFIYADETAPVAIAGLDAINLSDLPDDLRNALEQALCRIDTVAINQVIEQIRGHNTSLADALTTEANNFQYGRILKFLRTVSGADEPKDGL